MQTLIARQELVNMIINQCHLEQGWNVRKINLNRKKLIIIDLV